MRSALLVLALVAPALAAPMTPSAAPARARMIDPAVERGQGVAERRCVQCHAIRPGRDSADGDAPSFLVLRLRYNEFSLARRIAIVTRGEHAGMPPTALGDTDRRDLVRYIESLGPREP